MWFSIELDLRYTTYTILYLNKINSCAMRSSKEYISRIYKKLGRKTLKTPVRKIAIERAMKKKYITAKIIDIKAYNDYIFAWLDLNKLWNLDKADDVRVQSKECLIIILWNI